MAAPNTQGIGRFFATLAATPQIRQQAAQKMQGILDQQATQRALLGERAAQTDLARSKLTGQNLTNEREQKALEALGHISQYFVQAYHMPPKVAEAAAGLAITDPNANPDQIAHMVGSIIAHQAGATPNDLALAGAKPTMGVAGGAAYGKYGQPVTQGVGAQVAGEYRSAHPGAATAHVSKLVQGADGNTWILYSNGTSAPLMTAGSPVPYTGSMSAFMQALELNPQAMTMSPDEIAQAYLKFQQAMHKAHMDLGKQAAKGQTTPGAATAGSAAGSNDPNQLFSGGSGGGGV